MGANRSGQRRVEVWVDEAAYASAVSGKPRGWLTDEVRKLLERVDSDKRAVSLFGGFGSDEPVTEDDAVNDPKPDAGDKVHRFRRGKVIPNSTVFVQGRALHTFECACGCGEVAQQT